MSNKFKNMAASTTSIDLTAKNIIPGTKFKEVKKTFFFRPTQLSVAMAKAHIIPDSHLVKELASLALVRQKNDTMNIRPSVQLAF